MRLRLQIGAGLVLVLALALLAVGLPMRQQALQHAAARHDLHVHFRLQTLAAEIEARLSYGDGLSEIATIQTVLETVKASDPAIRALEVLSAEGVTLFSTDRALIGDRPDLAATPRLEQGTSLSLQNDLGEVVGFIRLDSTGAVLPEELARSLDQALLLGLALLTGAGLILGGLVLRRQQQNAKAFIAGLEGRELAARGAAARAGEAAARQIRAAEERLDQLSQQLAGADEEQDVARS